MTQYAPLLVLFVVAGCAGSGPESVPATQPTEEVAEPAQTTTTPEPNTEPIGEHETGPTTGEAREPIPLPEVIRPREGVIVAPPLRLAFLMRPDGGIEAFDPSSGDTKWTTTTAGLPLLLHDGMLIAQGEGTGGESGDRTQTFSLSAFDARTGKELCTLAAPAPGIIWTGIDAGLGKYLTVAATVRDGRIEVEWQSGSHYAGGAALPPKERARRARSEAGRIRFRPKKCLASTLEPLPGAAELDEEYVVAPREVDGGTVSIDRDPADESSVVYRRRASDRKEVTRRLDLPGDTTANVSIDGEQAFVMAYKRRGTKEVLFNGAVDLRTGKLWWESSDPLVVGPMMAGDRLVLVQRHDDGGYAVFRMTHLEAGTGEEVYSREVEAFRLDRDTPTSLGVTEDRRHFWVVAAERTAARTSTLHLFRTRDGERIATFDVNEFGAPLLLLDDVAILQYSPMLRGVDLGEEASEDSVRWAREIRQTGYRGPMPP